MEQNAKKKISCGGFMLGEGLVLSEDGKTLSVSGGGGGSVPKPLTYDYMPEGYPSKSVETVTLMEEQQVAFTSGDYFYMAPITNAFEVVGGQTYTVNWDGTEYECVGAAFGEKAYVLGNLSILGSGADTGEPFLYVYNAKQHAGQFSTLDTSASHTISVKTAEEIVTSMAAEFLPSEINELIMNSSTPNSTKKFKITVDDSGTLKATEV